MEENSKYRLRCISCGKEIPASPNALTCPDCGQFFGTLDVIYRLEELAPGAPGLSLLEREISVFEQFSVIFPFKYATSLPPIPVGQTPIFKSPNLGALTGIDELWIKDDSRNPSASFKDRASAMAIAMAIEAGAKVIAAASTGNAASSLATLAASAGLRAVVFVPKDAPRPKMIQMLIHGAQIIRLDCDYDRAFDICQEACRKFGWYNRNTAVNPFTGEGKKSAALEIARDLGFTPDVVICPVGDGCIIGGLYKGFFDLNGLGLIGKLPRMYGVQAKGANPLVRAFESNAQITPLANAQTIADSISVGYPRDGVKALRAVRETDGGMVAVADEEILEAQKTLAVKGGIFAEPAAAAAWAGLLRLLDRGEISVNESVVVLLTGHGLKDIDMAAKNMRIEIEPVAPNIEAISARLRDLNL